MYRPVHKDFPIILLKLVCQVEVLQEKGTKVETSNLFLGSTQRTRVPQKIPKVPCSSPHERVIGSEHGVPHRESFRKVRILINVRDERRFRRLYQSRFALLFPT